MQGFVDRDKLMQDLVALRKRRQQEWKATYFVNVEQLQERFNYYAGYSMALTDVAILLCDSVVNKEA